MANILLVSDTKSFIVSSLTKQLEALEHNVVQVANIPGEIERVEEKSELILVYAEADYTDKRALKYIKDKAIVDGAAVFALGDIEQLREMEEVITSQFIQKKILRPFNVKEVVEAINEYLQRDENAIKKKILVVDDSGAMLRNVKGWLEHKYQVILANSGAMALKYLGMNHPDLVLLDYEMPICDGKQVLEMIRAEEDFADIPVIFLTSKNDKESVMKVTALKPEGYLLKTMEPSRIVWEIDQFFERRNSAAN